MKINYLVTFVISSSCFETISSIFFSFSLRSVIDIIKGSTLLGCITCVGGVCSLSPLGSFFTLMGTTTSSFCVFEAEEHSILNSTPTSLIKDKKTNKWSSPNQTSTPWWLAPTVAWRNAQTSWVNRKIFYSADPRSIRSGMGKFARRTRPLHLKFRPRAFHFPY